MIPSKKYQYLLFRRQFLVSDIQFESYKDWHIHVVFHAGRQFCIHGHPDLEFTYAEKHFAIYLLGYILNPFKPEMTNQDIAEELARCNTCDKIFSKTDFLNVRYAMIISDYLNLQIINDATSSKQVYYLFKGKHFFGTGNLNLHTKGIATKVHIVRISTRCRVTDTATSEIYTVTH